jgi:SAM-dependent methyltransferase
MVELRRVRTGAGARPVEWLEADVEAQPFDSSSFDCVLSCFAAMFAPRPEVAAKEMRRVVRPGGVVGFANWTPGSFVGRLMQTVASFMPAPPAGVPSPVEWGIEDVVRARLDELSAEVTDQPSAVVMQHGSVEAMYDFHRRCNGPLVAARMVLGDRYVELEAAIRALIAELATSADGSCRIESEYLLVIGRKR